MTRPNGNGPAGPGDDLAALAALDRALDELAAGDVAASPIEGEAAVPPAAAGRRRRLPVRALALAAALVVLAAVPALARQARPGTALWPVRQAGQELRVSLAADPVRRAQLRLDTAEEYLAEGAGAGEERREDLADAAKDVIDEALDELKDVSGSRAAVERTRADRLLLAVRALEHQDDRGSGPGSSGPGSGEDRSGSGSGSDGSGSGDG
jgi:uncharacterized membrane protein YgcG